MTKNSEKIKQKVVQKRLILLILMANCGKKYLPFCFWKKQEEMCGRNCKLFCP